jgi:hypothetical protein
MNSFKTMKYLPIMLFTVCLLLTNCESREMLFNGTLGGEYIAQKAINSKTGNSYAVDYRLIIRDSVFLYKNGRLATTLTSISTIYKNAKEGKWVIQGYNFDERKNQYLRMVYSGWWDNMSNRYSPKGSLLISEKYEQAIDTVDVYYQRR